ncbi:MAG TPA: SUF system Fe-S cluster assembly regulator [Noviherbaspirillum sp.]
MLRLSKMADYGTVVMTAMLREPAQSRSASEIAEAIHVPVTTVSKILKILTRGGLVLSVRGAKGGYLLARPATEISIVDIIAVMDGPIGMTECSVTPGLCTQESGCVVRANWRRINRAVIGVLQGITLDQMIAPVGPATQTVDVKSIARAPAASAAAPTDKPATKRGATSSKRETA